MEQTERTLHAPGLYFGLPAAEYHADPALGSSNIKDLLESPLTYWINSRLNPDYEEEEDTAATFDGSAFHKRLLEGAEAFAAEYAVMPDPADYPDALSGGDTLKSKCKELGLKASGTLLEMARAIAEVDSSLQLWPLIKAEADEQAAGRIPIKAAEARRIEAAATVIEHHPSARKALSGGFAEVSIFWVDEETGVRCKCRIDYLKTRAGIDLKTFSNSQGLPVDLAVSRAVANYRYHVQAVHYSEGIERAKRLADQGNVFGEAVPPDEWLKAFASNPEHVFVFVFLQSGRVPNLRVREFRRMAEEGQTGGDHDENLYWQQGMLGFRRGIDLFVAGMERHGADKPWHDNQPMRPFRDDDFPLYMFN